MEVKIMGKNVTVYTSMKYICYQISYLASNNVLENLMLDGELREWVIFESLIKDPTTAREAESQKLLFCFLLCQLSYLQPLLNGTHIGEIFTVLEHQSHFFRSLLSLLLSAKMELDHSNLGEGCT